MRKNLIKKALIVCSAIMAMGANKLTAQVTPENYYQASNNGGANAVFNSDYHTRMQHLYYPSDFLNTPTAGNISKIYMRASSARTNATFFNLVVRMGTTTATQLTNAAWSNTGLDTVFFKPTHIFPQITGNQWFEIALDEPFYWDGTSNLIVDIAQDSFSGGFVLQFNNPGGTPAPRTKYGPKNGTPFLNNYPPVFFGYDGCTIPEINLGNDTTICEGTMVTLDAGNINSPFTWSTNDTTQTIDVTSAGQYILFAGSEGCITSDTINITELLNPTADAINATLNLPTTYDFQVVNPNDVTTYTWDFGDGNTGTGAPVSHTYAQLGEYDITLIISNDCGSDTLVYKITDATSINNIKLNEAMSIYPNPTSGDLNIKLKQADMQLRGITLTNVLGQVVLQEKAQGHNQQLNCAALSNGIYTMTIKTNKGNYTTKVEILK